MMVGHARPSPLHPETGDSTSEPLLVAHPRQGGSPVQELKGWASPQRPVVAGSERAAKLGRRLVPPPRETMRRRGGRLATVQFPMSVGGYAHAELMRPLILSEHVPGRAEGTWRRLAQLHSAGAGHTSHQD
jgi:hypothetical protein